MHAFKRFFLNCFCCCLVERQQLKEELRRKLIEELERERLGNTLFTGQQSNNCRELYNNHLKHIQTYRDSEEEEEEAEY